ncbi:hypothetical protein FA15DRAFT_254664 [Coprinopsis marcescibilis]|uniref:Uncharacterized protein n=1 Tax=Coprinopsis marcescibilis TaxID=230819 RepID=A0A5C3KF54_COPMA|nr:hypothetical protein FA15DRAFT_254664 [Coprinopsis marcescibilis]
MPPATNVPAPILSYLILTLPRPIYVMYIPTYRMYVGRRVPPSATRYVHAGQPDNKLEFEFHAATPPSNEAERLLLLQAATLLLMCT